MKNTKIKNPWINRGSRGRISHVQKTQLSTSLINQ